MPCSFIILWDGKRQQHNFAMGRIHEVEAIVMASTEALKVGLVGCLAMIMGY